MPVPTKTAALSLLCQENTKDLTLVSLFVLYILTSIQQSADRKPKGGVKAENQPVGLWVCWELRSTLGAKLWV